jgi:hypothetical protein
MAMDPATIKQITDDLEATYRALNSAAGNLDKLLAIGQATCDEVQVYDLWAISTYNLQKGMLDTLRAAGQPGIPNRPPDPRLYAWHGVDGSQAYNFDCSGSKSLSGAMARALRGPTATSQLLSFNEVRAINQIPPPPGPGVPTFAQMANRGTGLGNPIPLIIWIALAVITLIAVAEFVSYLEENAIQVEQTNRTRVQAEAYDKFLAARAECFSAQVARGVAPGDATNACAKLVEAPQIDMPGNGLGFFGWLGVISAAGVGGMGLLFYLQRKYGAGHASHEA